MTATGARVVGNKTAGPLIALTTFAIISSAQATVHPEPTNPIDDDSLQPISNAAAALQAIDDQQGQAIRAMQRYRPQRSYLPRPRHYKIPARSPRHVRRCLHPASGPQGVNLIAARGQPARSHGRLSLHCAVRRRQSVPYRGTAADLIYLARLPSCANIAARGGLVHAYLA